MHACGAGLVPAILLMHSPASTILQWLLRAHIFVLSDNRRFRIIPCASLGKNLQSAVRAAEGPLSDPKEINVATGIRNDCARNAD